jgi:quercetin dioxygenase-like cupin family protein
VITSRSRLHYREFPGRDSADPFESGPGDGFSMRVVRLEGGRRRWPHRHPHSQEAIYVVRGKGLLWEDGVRRPFEAGDCALIEAGVAHATIPDAGTSMELVCFFPHPDLSRNLEEIEELLIVDGERDKAEE